MRNLLMLSAIAAATATFAAPDTAKAGHCRYDRGGYYSSGYYAPRSYSYGHYSPRYYGSRYSYSYPSYSHYGYSHHSYYSHHGHGGLHFSFGGHHH